ncbi:M13 family metallopeptidase [Stenotrophomonas maltophilia]|uniref:Peptidase n=1 Tax=Stenotrophomonas pavanii TaxID=487698 RepID=A0A246L065_9GAMM|nr:MULTISPECIES: M13 family metallopeptidase [Stenotrophomonas]KAA3598594.1 M13 family peptidase [Stenotrophomonas maltophilia]TGR52098.1 M13 family peptidase [bacterium M00.F.Ca.ET.199.01.1.1]TGT05697.1 M13 family peptidase [bacterium M00.F.Ca.ET.177.01.1.1]TGT62774.1 M13 family peptidase [Mesorhizobium sp. M00.F.Ca.ET.170.01.1.1]TGU14122.1 M13 family peptidase [bacterium M00.F.Ca.ET.163.01.1.1]TGU96025.1 M13 family peptidase [Mesorhizobium sp. M00.F.Ca.ET.151.01.1.1]TGV58804.1 M13 family p
MNVRNLVPLGLTIAIAASLAACGKNETAPAASADAKPAFDLSQIKTPLISLNSADLDPAISACTDLNGFVNSKWLKANPVPGDQTTWGSFEILRERSLEVQHALVQQAAASQAKAGSVEAKIGDIWKTGNDEAKIEAAGLAPLQPQLDKIAALNDTAAITRYLRDSQAEGKGVLFSLFANADYKDSANVIAYVGQGGLGLPEKGYYFDDAQAKIRDAYVAYIAQVLTLSGVDAAQAAEQAKAVMAFETRLAKASMSRIEMRDPAKRYNPLSAADADRLTPNFSWTALFDTLKVPAAQKFSLAQPGFFSEMDKMLADVPASTWQAYLRFHTIDDASPYLSSQFEKANFDFYGTTLRGQKEMQPRWKRVLESVNGGMGEALGQLYVDAVFPAESKVAMQHLVENLSQALKARLEQLPWMGEETKKKALEKWASFTPKIGYPDKWRDWAGLQTNGDSYLGNMQAARAFNYRYMLDKIGKPVDKTEWGMTPQTVNAYYNATKNEIVFPAAILQAPFFDAKADPALNYGGIGAVIGHEMMHGYDDSGSQFAANGNFDNWWTDADRKAFTERTDQLVAQFDGYEAVPGVNVKGKLTLGENIGDLGGLTVAYDALQMALKEDPKANVEVDGHSQDQRFFMNWATVWRRNFTDGELRVRLNTDPHAPANFRANGAPSNMPSFAAAFQCKAGDAMVRADDKRVVIW